MGMPNIPDIKPEINIDTEETINILLASIALEELGLAHIINAEGEKIQEMLLRHKCEKLDDYIRLNDSVTKTLQTIIKQEMLLQFKFENILSLIDKSQRPKKHKPREDYGSI